MCRSCIFHKILYVSIDTACFYNYLIFTLYYYYYCFEISYVFKSNTFDFICIINFIDISDIDQVYFIRFYKFQNDTACFYNHYLDKPVFIITLNYCNYLEISYVFSKQYFRFHLYY